jgi:enamine deaminase RidA (YjgF/YER057c/UK114 family)
MAREILNPSELQPARGFSHVAIGRGSRVVHVAGQVPVEPDFTLVGEGDLAAQTRAAMRNLGRALEAAGAGWDDVVRRTVYTTRPTDHQTIRQAMEEVVGDREHPPQSIVGVTGLASERFLIEIEATAVLD